MSLNFEKHLSLVEFVAGITKTNSTIFPTYRKYFLELGSIFLKYIITSSKNKLSFVGKLARIFCNFPS